jgi:hypothetical protein
LKTGQGRKKRPDPVRRHVDGASAYSKLQNTDPTRSYVWVPAGDKNAIANYNYMGYSTEKYRNGGVAPLGTSELEGTEGAMREGAPIQGPYGCILMSCSAARKREIDAVGPDGSTGQQEVSRIERHIIDNRGGMDPLRGITGLSRPGGDDYVTVDKKISPLRTELVPFDDEGDQDD